MRQHTTKALPWALTLIGLASVLGATTPALALTDVKAIPWVATAPGIPHDNYNGRATTFKAVARGVAGSCRYQWDHGDNTSSVVLTAGRASHTSFCNLTHRYRYPIATRRPVSTLVTSRGCIHRCVFCDKSVGGSRPRRHSARRVLAELEEIATAGPGYAVFFDDDFTAERERVVDICEGMIRRELPLQWKCESRADGVDADLLALMRRAGCTTVALGVESVRDESLRWLRKDLDVEQIRRAFELCRAADLDVLAYALVGIPGETPADVDATVDFCKDHGARWVQFSTLSPYLGTPLYDQAVREGWYVHSTLRNPADAEKMRPTVVAPPWDLTTLGITLTRAYARFYVRPGVIAREVGAGLRNDWRSALRSVAGFGGWIALEGFIGMAHRSGLVDVLFPDDEKR